MQRRAIAGMQRRAIVSKQGKVRAWPTSSTDVQSPASSRQIRGASFFGTTHLPRTVVCAHAASILPMCARRNVKAVGQDAAFAEIISCRAHFLLRASSCANLRRRAAASWSQTACVIALHSYVSSLCGAHLRRAHGRVGKRGRKHHR